MRKMICVINNGKHNAYAIYILLIIPKSLMIEGDSPRKNLWRNLNKQKAKYSCVEQTNNSPVISYSNQSHHLSEPIRPLQLEKAIEQTEYHNKFQSNFSNVEKQIDLNIEQCPNFMESNTNFMQKIGMSKDVSQAQKHNQSKSRRLSIGEQSVVQEVVDFKFQNILEIGDQQDQQPMIMSLGSQSNPAIRLLKLSRVKDDVQRLQNTRIQILNFIRQQKERYKQFFQTKFHETLAYVIQFYSDKMRIDWDDNVEKSQKQTKVTNIKKVRSIVSEDTPRFAKHMSSLASQKIQKITSQQINLQQLFQQWIQQLQQQIFKQKTNNQSLAEAIQQLRKQNEEMSEQIFDYEQKIAQFELQVNEKVEELLTKRMKDSLKMRSRQEAQNQRRQYLDQILSLEREIQKLEKKSYNKQYMKMQEELVRRQQQIIQKQKDIYEKERILNQLQVQLNSDKLDMQKKLKNIQVMEHEIRLAQSKLQQMEIDLAMKERQINNKQLQKQTDDNNRSQTHQSGFHRQPNADYDYNLDFKLKSLSYKANSTVKPRYVRQDKDWNHSASNAGLQNNRNWRYPIQMQKSESQKKSIYSVAKKSKSKQKQKQKQIRLFDKPSQLIINRLGTPTNKTRSHNYTFSHSSNLKSQDKTRLQDLGAKLQNLRNQIRKQIRDSE